MTLSQMKTFAAVCRHMSFTGAAEELYLSQPAVSRQISAMEEELGMQLFVRSHNTILFTDAGRHLAREMVPLVERLGTVFHQARQLSEGLIGHLHVGLLEDQRVDPFLADLLRALSRPKVHLTIRRMTFLELEKALHDGSIDVAVGLEQGEQAFAGCCRLLYRQERMGLALHRDLLPRDVGEEIGTEWPQLPCPVYIPGLDSFPAGQYSELAGIRTLEDWQVQEHDFDSIAPIVAAGLGGAITNEGSTLAADGELAFVPVKAARWVSRGLFWREDNQNPVLRRFLGMAGEEN